MLSELYEDGEVRDADVRGRRRESLVAQGWVPGAFGLIGLSDGGRDMRRRAAWSEGSSASGSMWKTFRKFAGRDGGLFGGVKN